MGLGLNARVELVEKEGLLLGALKEVNLNGVVIVDEQPSSGVNELSALGFGDLSFTFSHTSDLDLSGWEEIHSWDGLVSNGDLSLGGSNVDTSESVEILEESTVWSSHGKLNLWQLWENTEISHIEGAHNWLLHIDSSNTLGEHFVFDRDFYKINYIFYIKVTY